MQPRYASYVSLWRAQVSQSKLAAAESTVTLLTTRFPNVQTMPAHGISIALAGLDFDLAAARAARWRASATSPAMRTLAVNRLVQIARVRGRLAEARRLASETNAERTQSGVPTGSFGDSLEAALTSLSIEGRPALAIRAQPGSLRLAPSNQRRAAGAARSG